MSTPCVILPVVTANPALPTYDWQTIPNLPEYETDAGDHFLFDRAGPANLRGRLTDTVLTPAGAAPTHNAKSLTMPDGGVNGLRTIFDDALTMTVTFVVKRGVSPPAGSGRPLVSSTTATAGEGGSEALDLGTSISMRTRQGAAVAIPGHTVITPGTWFFGAISQDGSTSDGNPISQIYYVGGLAPQLPAPVTKTIGSRKIALGNGAITSAGYLYGIEAAEMIVWPDRALSLDELQAVYLRSKIRMSRRGLTVF